MSCSVEEARSVLANAECRYNAIQINHALDAMAAAMAKNLEEKNPLILCVMNGGLITTTQLILRLAFPLQYDYVHATRYRGKTEGAELHWLAHPSVSISGRHVVLVDDIFDEGITLHKLVDYCLAQGVSAVSTAVLVNKRHNRKSGPTPDYVGVDVDDRYVFGFGMDYKGYLRNANGIYLVRE